MPALSLPHDSEKVAIFPSVPLISDSLQSHKVSFCELGLPRIACLLVWEQVSYEVFDVSFDKLAELYKAEDRLGGDLGAQQQLGVSDQQGRHIERNRDLGEKALWGAPRNALILRFYFVHLENSSTCQRGL